MTVRRPVASHRLRRHPMYVSFKYPCIQKPTFLRMERAMDDSNTKRTKLQMQPDTPCLNRFTPLFYRLRV